MVKKSNTSLTALLAVLEAAAKGISLIEPAVTLNPATVRFFLALCRPIVARAQKLVAAVILLRAHLAENTQ